MKLEQIWQDFTGAMAEVELLLRATRAATKSEMHLLLKSEDAFQKQKGVDFQSMHNMSFRDLKTGRHVFYDQRGLTIEETKFRLLLRKNKQYQWLLVEAYEAFEQFLTQLYALLGSSGIDCWPMKDYGNVTICESRTKDFAWYLKQAKRKQYLPHSILDAVRNAFPTLRSAELNNFRKIHVAFSVAFIAQLRHQIVHNRGWTASKDELVLDVARQVGLYNNGKVSKQYVAFARDFFGTGEHENMVALLEVATHPEVPLDTYVCRLGALFEILMGYANLMVQTVEPSVTQARAEQFR